MVGEQWLLTVSTLQGGERPEVLGDLGSEEEEEELGCRFGEPKGRDLGRSELPSAWGGEALRPRTGQLRRRGRLPSSRSLMVRMW